MKHLAYYCHLEILGAIFSGCRDSNVIIKFVNLGKYIQLVYQQHLWKPLEKIMPHYFLNDRANTIVEIVAEAIFFMVIMLYCT